MRETENWTIQLLSSFKEITFLRLIDFTKWQTIFFQRDPGEGTSKQSCSICGVFVTMLQQTPKGSMCGTCYTHFRYL